MPDKLQIYQSQALDIIHIMSDKYKYIKKLSKNSFIWNVMM